MTEIFNDEFTYQDLIGAWVEEGKIEKINVTSKHLSPTTYVIEIYDPDEQKTILVESINDLKFYIGEDSHSLEEYKNILVSMDKNEYPLNSYDYLIFSIRRYIKKKQLEGCSGVELEYENISSNIHDAISLTLRNDKLNIFQRFTEECDWKEHHKSVSYFYITW